MSIQYREERGISHLDLKVPKLRYEGAVKYVELYKRDKWYASIVIEINEPKAEEPKENL